MSNHTETKRRDWFDNCTGKYSISSGNKKANGEERTQEKEIAEKAGYTSKELSDMLNGQKLIRACDIPRLAYALKVTANEIYETGKKSR